AWASKGRTNSQNRHGRGPGTGAAATPEGTRGKRTAMTDNNTTAAGEPGDAGDGIVQRGLWFEEYREGARYLHRPGRTVTETDDVLFTTLTMNTQPLHLDAHWSSQQPGFGGKRLVNSMWTLSTVVGLSVSQLTLGTIVANLG